MLSVRHQSPDIIREKKSNSRCNSNVLSHKKNYVTFNSRKSLFLLGNLKSTNMDKTRSIGNTFNKQFLQYLQNQLNLVYMFYFVYTSYRWNDDFSSYLSILGSSVVSQHIFGQIKTLKSKLVQNNLKLHRLVKGNILVLTRRGHMLENRIQSTDRSTVKY